MFNLSLLWPTQQFITTMCVSGFARGTPTCPQGRIHKPRIHNPFGCLDLCLRTRLLFAERATHRTHAISSHRYPKSLPPAPLSRRSLPPAAQSSCLRLSRRPSFAPRDRHNATSVAHFGSSRALAMTMPDATTGCKDGILTLPLLTLGEGGAHDEAPAIWPFPISHAHASSANGRGGIRCNCRNN